MAPADARLSSCADEIDPAARAFYREAMETLRRAGLPVLLGGAFALERYAGIARNTKDLDLFVRPDDFEMVLDALARAGYRTEVPYPHWLGKAYCGEEFVDIIFSSGNGIATVDAEWFAHAVDEEILGLPVQLCPPEETIWSKAFIMERERYDGADVAHILRTCAEQLDWVRLLRRFGPQWRVLLSHLILFGFAYPAERRRIPGFVMRTLLRQLQHEHASEAPRDPVCQGTLLSREQYLIDVGSWGYQDARLLPRGSMTEEEAAIWTAAIDQAERKAS
jgi:hypothetical protein